jgi:hypothetical protein
MADSIPELKRILNQAVNQSWTTDRFLMKVASTHWYRTTSGNMRQWITLWKTDPAQARAQIDDTMWKIHVMAGQLGATNLTNAELRNIARLQILHPMDEQGLKNAIAKWGFDALSQGEGTFAGQAAETDQQVRELAQNYGYTKTGDAYTLGWVNRIMRGSDTVDGFKQAMQFQAKAKYAGMADQIDAGMTVTDVAKPLMQKQAELLELPETSVTLDDKLLNQALQARNENGQPTIMSTNEFAKQVRQDQRYRFTNGAKTEAAKALNAIGTTFGMLK